jgi:hypothetical protein
MSPRDDNIRITIGNKPMTVEDNPDEWVFHVDPHDYPKASAGDVKPVFVPKRLEQLQGPLDGIIQLPLSVYWGPKRWFSLTNRNQLRLAYSTLLSEADTIELQTYVNYKVLQSVWLDLVIPEKVRHLWELYQPEVARWQKTFRQR